MYEEGQGVPQDYKTALEWYRLAAGRGDTDAQKAVRDLEKKIASEKATPPVIAKKAPEPTPNPRQQEAAPAARPDINLAGTGTGFSITRSGHMLTNHHVIKGCQLVVLHIEGSVKKTTVLARDKTNDLALLKANFTPKAVFSIKQKNADLMEDIMVAGYPFGRSVSSSVKITRGIVSSLTGVGDNYSNMQIDAAIQPGNSGGPIIDENGNVVGVAVARLDKIHFMKERGTIPENSNFGIKSSIAYNFAEANGIELPRENRGKMTRRDMGKLVTKGTHYLSCWMTKQQLAKAQNKKELAMDIDPTLLRTIRGFADLRN
jgi:S1-C subfamily serine protease